MLQHDLQPFGGRLFFAASRRRSANHEYCARDRLVRSSYRAEFDRFFLGGAAFAAEANTQWASCSEGAPSWDLTRWLRAQGHPSARQLEIHERCTDLGLVNGYTVSLRNRGSGLVSGFGLSADAVSRQRDVDKVWIEYGKNILCLLVACSCC